MLEYFHPWPNSAGFYLARQQKWYEQNGLDLHITAPDPWHGDSLEHLLQARADFAVAPVNRLLVRRDEGEPLRAIAAINHSALETIQTLRSKNINRPRDLAGRKLAMNPTPRGLAMIRHLVASDGGDPDAVKIVNSQFREFRPEDLQNGLADASFGGYWAWEALMDSAIPQEERLVWPLGQLGAPPYHSYVLCTRDDIIETTPDKVRSFLKASDKGFLAAAQNPLAALPAYELATPYFPTELLSQSLTAIAPTWLHNGKWGELRPDVMEEYTHWLAKNAIVSDRNIWRSAVIEQDFRHSVQDHS
ncbi:ABC transporter substrate-binding protein [Acetobacter okinawensis]|uniref:Thiamine pyrimidine synthase n=2 Tax=Acetobacter okinawensis TaxID=1076594 RepID=A0A252BUG9_9PROT|nr:ABC transporter substrate-binding protein [Acetobacter okinawensis]